jgi:plasmid stabilization system protein ParE
MRYTVEYTPAAYNDLASIWNQASDQQAVADAADEIDWLLARFPERHGQPYNGYRVHSVWPLEVLYEIIPDDRRVRVLEVTFIGLT